MKFVSLDTETTGLQFYKHDIFGISWCTNPNDTQFKLIEEVDASWLRTLLNSNERICGHNIKFDLHFLKKLGYPIPKNIDDTMIMSALINENGSHSLQNVAVRYLNIPKWKDGVKEYVKKHNCTYKEVPHNTMKEYAANDALRTWQISNVLYPLLERKGVKELYDSEMILLKNMLEIEERGLLIDTKLLKKLRIELEKDEKKWLKNVYDVIGKTFNVNSDDELADLLFNKLKLPVQGYTLKDHKPKVDVYALEKLNHPVISPILNYRTASKMKSTYCDNIANYIDDNNILHPNFRQHGTVTGRFSCAEPNLQNIPKNHAVRELFICRPNYTNFYFDYGQQEMRIYAHYANDQKMINMFKVGVDIYKEMAKVYYKKNDISKDERDFIKNFTLGILYGMGARGISQRYNKTIDEAWRLKNHYNFTFPLMKKFSYHIMSKIKQDGFIKNIFGRKRRLTPDKTYKGLNALIQGTAGDIMKRKINEVSILLKDTKSYIFNSIHDELCVEIHNSEKYLVNEIKTIMEDIPQISIKLPIDIKYTTTNWGQLKEWNNGTT